MITFFTLKTLKLNNNKYMVLAPILGVTSLIFLCSKSHAAKACYKYLDTAEIIYLTERFDYDRNLNQSPKNGLELEITSRALLYTNAKFGFYMVMKSGKKVWVRLRILEEEDSDVLDAYLEQDPSINQDHPKLFKRKSRTSIDKFRETHNVIIRGTVQYFTTTSEWVLNVEEPIRIINTNLNVRSDGTLGEAEVFYFK